MMVAECETTKKRSIAAPLAGFYLDLDDQAV